MKGGKGFLGIHNATDTCYDWPEYAEMLGGWFNGHPWHQEVGVIVEDGDHPATRTLGDRFTVVDEIYTFKNWDRTKTRVLMRIDNDTVDLAKGEPGGSRLRNGLVPFVWGGACDVYGARAS